MSDEHNDFDGITYRPETSSPAVFQILFGVLVVWGIGFMAYYLFSGWSSEAEFAAKKKAKETRLAATQPGPQAAAPVAGPKQDKAELAALGKKEYAERCAACHGAEGKGGIGPDLTSKQYKYGRTEEAIARSIGEGRPGGMPAFPIAKEKIGQLAAYLLSL